MKCVICQYGETEPGTTVVTLTRDETTVVIRDVPAQICAICGEEYVDAATGKRLSQIAESAVNEGVQWMYDAIKLPKSPDNLPCRLQEILLYGTLRPVLMRVEVDGDSPYPQMRSFVHENNSFTRC